MTEDASRVREIAWSEIFPWLGLLRAVRLAFAPRMLILAALGVWATGAGWGFIGWIFDGSTDPNFVVAREIIEPLRNPSLPATLPPVGIAALDPAASAASLPWENLSRPLRELFEWQVSLTSFTYLFLCALWALLVWSIFGAAITRSAALWFAREDRLGFRRSLGWGVARWPAYFGGPVFPLVGVFIAVVPIALLGILLKFDIGLLLASVLWPLAILCGMFLAILLVGLLFGWPLMWPTISAEGTDSFDALSRSYSYTYQRPLHYLFYAAVAGVLGALAFVVVLIFARGVINYSFWAASWGSGGARMQEIMDVVKLTMVTDATRPAEVSWALWNGAILVGFWVAVVNTVAIGYLFAFFWCAATYIYFLLRQAVDATEPDEVALDEEPETYGLPPLKTDPDAVPRVVETSTITTGDSAPNGPSS